MLEMGSLSAAALRKPSFSSRIKLGIFQQRWSSFLIGVLGVHEFPVVSMPIPKRAENETTAFGA